MMDYYDVLGVAPEATTLEIKSAFRKKAKIQHPDSKNGTAESMRLLLDAYQVLVNPSARREYDRGKLRIIRNQATSAFDYRVWLKERLDSYEYAAKLIFYDLLHAFEDEALVLYDKAKDIDEARMERFFERNESMDAEYCIAEEYAKRGRFDDAFAVFSKLVKMEQRQSGFGYFYEVVLLRFKKLVLDDYSSLLDNEMMLKLLDDAIELRSSAENDAFFMKRKAEILSRQGLHEEANTIMKKARILYPKLDGKKSARARR